MPTMQNTRTEIAQQIRDQVRSEVQAAQDAAAQARQQAQPAGQAGKAPPAPQAPVVALPPIPAGGGRLVIDRQGDRTIVTSAQLPPELLPMARMAQDTAYGLFAMIVAVVVLGPFARMIARRMDRHTEIKAAGEHSQVLSQQIYQLQQSVDAMSLEVERVSEAQRFQSKLLSERTGTQR
jgi:hypothetical protein